MFLRSTRGPSEEERTKLCKIVTLNGIKTISNYVNHSVDTEIDESFR